MKCEDCQGTGLENENKVCANCQGFGKIGEEVEEVKKVKVEKSLIKKLLKKK